MTSTPGLAAFDVREIPFSYRGSWLDLSPVVGFHETSDVIHLVSHVNGMHAVLRLHPQRAGSTVATTWHADPTRLVWRETDGTGEVAAVFESTTVVRLRGSGLALRIQDAAPGLTSWSGSFLVTDPLDDAGLFSSYETGRRYRIRGLRGSLRVEGDGALGVADRAVVLGADDQPWEATLEEVTSGGTTGPGASTFDELVDRVRAEFGVYLDAVAPWRTDETPAATLATYVLWSATVEPGGFMTRESVLMSKHWMDKLWSWDHCFNALALASGLPELALDQLQAPFDHQDDSGALPDSISHSEVLFNFVKPPVHGWTLRRLRADHDLPLSGSRLREVYDRLARWTRFWLDVRRRPGHELPCYHHGNDSGWDNSTTFDRDRVLESPDLAAFLVVQLDVLAELAAELGEDAAGWTVLGDRLLDALLDQLWTGEELVGVGALSGARSTATSLMNLLPLVLGERLPEAVRTTLAARVSAHLTPHGLATEPTDSPLYEDDGYWRGPIWAPSTALVEDGLRACGFGELADTVNLRFRRLCERSGFAENFDARTGAGLRDRAYTWTAAVYLLFAADHLRRSGPPRVARPQRAGSPSTTAPETGSVA